MASGAATGSIAECVAQSLAAFEAIDTVETRAELGDSQVTLVQTINDLLSKFKLWAGNIGAHRTGRSSLDYRLRDSSHLSTQVMRLLGDLTTSLNEVYSILSGETVPWDQDSGEVSELDEELKDLLMDEDFEFDSEVGQLTKEIADAIGNLLRLSMSLRNPAPHDRFMSTEYAKVHYFEANDKAHVQAKFPRASQTLIIRLGQALSQRRQYFRYRKSHHEKLARALFDSGRSKTGAQSTVASSIPLVMRVPRAVPVLGELDEDECSNTGLSQTSFASTAPDSEPLRIPPLPKKSHEGPFECPFCFMLISVSSTPQWKKHVLRDLRPYICLAEDCPAASKEYGRRHEWTSHMLQKHWKSWECPHQCGSDYTTETNLREHVTRVHGSATEMELDAMIARCGRSRSLSPSPPVECPLCQDTLESIQQYQRHVGRHQVDLALFALPKIVDTDEEPDEGNEDQEAISLRSGSYSEALSDISHTALAETTETINGVCEGDDEAERQDIDYEGSNLRYHEIFDELADAEPRVKHLDSREEPTPPPPAVARVVIRNRNYNVLSDSESEGDSHASRPSRSRAHSRVSVCYSRERDAWIPQNAREELDPCGAKRELDAIREREREYEARMQKHLLKSGFDEKEINAILAGKKIEKEKKEEKDYTIPTEDKPRHTFTRMARRHLSLETLRVYGIDYKIDTDSQYILINRWVPVPEQVILRRHTRVLREQRGKLVLSMEDRKDKNHHPFLESEYEWARKKEGRRSPSPSLLAYLAGRRPA